MILYFKTLIKRELLIISKSEKRFARPLTQLAMVICFESSFCVTLQHFLQSAIKITEEETKV